MSDETDRELAATRAALAPTLQAAADILPWLAEARQPRFPPEQATQWQEICHRLNAAWLERLHGGMEQLRPAVIDLCALALELNDADCLHLAEALASACDCLEDPGRLDDARLLAALSASCECLTGDCGLEHPAFGERTRHLAERLERASRRRSAEIRSPALDHIFASDASERLDAMHEALERLPPDAYAIKAAAEDIIDLAEPLELQDIIDRARILLARLTPRSGTHLDLDEPETRSGVLACIDLLEEAVAAMMPAD